MPTTAPPGSTVELPLARAWGADYAVAYQEKSAAEHARRRAAKRARLARASAAPRLMTPEQRAKAEIREAQAVSRCRVVALRLERGHRWGIGLVGGNPVYRHEACITRGLISDESPILKFFVSKLRRAYWKRDPALRLKSGATKVVVEDADSKLLACDEAYIEANKRCCGILRVDIDRIVTAGEIEQACRDAGVPAPNIVIGWTDPLDGRRRFHNPHLMWLLENSVPLTDKGWRCKKLYWGVLCGLTKALLAFGADPKGLYNAHRHKNPVSPLWDRVVMAQAPYQLEELKSHVDTACTRDALIAMAGLVQPVGRRIPDHPDCEIAASSNRLFGELSLLARCEVNAFRTAGQDQSGFATWLAEQAIPLASELLGDSVRYKEQARRTAASIANWTWCHFRCTAVPRVLTVGERAKAHADGGRKGAAKRRDCTMTKITTLLRYLAAEPAGVPGKADSIAALVAAGACSYRTAHRRWPEIANVLASGPVMSQMALV